MKNANRRYRSAFVAWVLCAPAVSCLFAACGDDSDNGSEDNANGELVWAKGAGGSYTDCAGNIAALPDGSAPVTGNFEIWATFGRGEANETSLISAGDQDIFVAKFGP